MRMFLMIAALPLAACGGIASGSDSGTRATASGSGSSRSFQVADFTAVDLRGFDDVDVRVGGAFAVTADGPSEELDRLDIRKDGDTLKVGRKREDWGRDGKAVKVHVTMPRIAAASVAGSGDLTVDKASGDTFDASIAGSGNLSIGTLSAKSAELDIAGSGDLTAAGRADRVKSSIAGSGNVNARSLKTAGADVSIAGSGNVSLDVDGPAKVTIMGSGDAAMGPNAKCSTTAMGSGEARCG